MNKSILVFGNGFLGSRISGAFGCPVSARRITCLEDAMQELAAHRPAAAINAIGFTGQRNVDDCEKDKEKTLFANAIVPLFLAEACMRSAVKLVQISSGCIYHYDYAKDKPLSEETVPDFFELYYSRTKIYAEEALLPFCRRFRTLIARVRIPLDNQPHPKNILTKLIAAQKVISIPNSITYIPDFLRALRHLIDRDACGIYNVVNSGSLIYPELMDAYRRLRPGFEYSLLDYAALNAVRTNLILSTEKLARSGFAVRDIHEVLEECVREYLSFS